MRVASTATKVRRIKFNTAARHSAAAKAEARAPTPHIYCPALVLQSIETVIATAPQEMWSYFADWDFLVERLQFFRVPNPPDP
jgi:hypothetical protein